MAPPYLAGYAPVTDIFHPIVIGLGPYVGNDAGLAGFNSLNCFLGQGFDLYKPLPRKIRFNHCFAAVAVSNIVFVGLDFFEKFLFLQRFNDCFSGIEAVQAFEFPCRRRHFAIISDYLYNRQAVSYADFKVIGIMRRCHLQPAGTKRHIHIAVFDQRNDSVHQRQNNRL